MRRGRRAPTAVVRRQIERARGSRSIWRGPAQPNARSVLRISTLASTKSARLPPMARTSSRTWGAWRCLASTLPVSSSSRRRARRTADGPGEVVQFVGGVGRHGSRVGCRRDVAWGGMADGVGEDEPERQSINPARCVRRVKRGEAEPAGTRPPTPCVPTPAGAPPTEGPHSDFRCIPGAIPDARDVSVSRDPGRRPSDPGGTSIGLLR
jgi:hypothetical protein